MENKELHDYIYERISNIIDFHANDLEPGNEQGHGYSFYETVAMIGNVVHEKSLECDKDTSEVLMAFNSAFTIIEQKMRCNNTTKGEINDE